MTFCIFVIYEDQKPSFNWSENQKLENDFDEIPNTKKYKGAPYIN